jgi:hypothetical protein
MGKRSYDEVESDVRKQKSDGSVAKKKIKYDISLQFRMTDDKLREFIRLVPKPMDCVINALQLIGYVNKDTAALMRILVGTVGVPIEQLEEIFNWIDRSNQCKYKFRCLTKKGDVDEIIEDELKPGHVIFAGVEFADSGFRHVFIVGKYTNGTVVYIDPQEKTLVNTLSSYQHTVSKFFVLKKESCVKK